MTFSFTDRYLMATSDGRDSGLFWCLWSPLEWAGGERGRLFYVWGEVPPVWGELGGGAPDSPRLHNPHPQAQLKKDADVYL